MLEYYIKTVLEWNKCCYDINYIKPNEVMVFCRGKN